MNSYFRNEEIKSITIKFLIIQVLMFVCLFIFFNGSMSDLNKRYISSNKVIASKILNKYPYEKEDIIKVFTKGVTNAEIKKSQSILNDYGYTYELDSYKNPLIDKFGSVTLIRGFCILILFMFIVYFVIFNTLKGMLKKVREICRASEALVDGKFDISFPEGGEGEFYVLGHEFNVMAKRLKENLANLKKDKIQLKNIISDISHQLKTPLAALVMYNDIMLSDSEMELKDRKNFLQKSLEQLNRMQWLVVNLLKMARLEAGAVEFNIRSENLLHTVQNALKPLSYKAKEKKQNMLLNINKDTKFKHDVQWTAEAISNIIKNAIEHAGEGGTIEISSEETPLSLQINIKDNGEGIDNKNLNKIFERFYKGENSTNPESIGIGLALSKRIIESEGGSIVVRSELGVGTEFKITFLKTII
ncbi:HAMP domain-containing sensor histidine kinase [Clostridium hydrogenum]|uniref:HAMP domain-containing sensor histidine kinase n=1 Tax=Clostridium hydrogenum TaxID=2855764 RepID=UPI001F2E22C6|nr:HAMP domain-containing sensor histidine kinase [Clostridium hydrogenum]